MSEHTRVHGMPGCAHAPVRAMSKRLMRRREEARSKRPPKLRGAQVGVWLCFLGRRGKKMCFELKFP